MRIEIDKTDFYFAFGWYLIAGTFQNKLYVYILYSESGSGRKLPENYCGHK